MTITPPPRARVTIESRRLWSLRASRSLVRWALYALALAGLAAGLRAALAPPLAATRVGLPLPGTALAPHAFAVNRRVDAIHTAGRWQITEVEP